MAARNVGHNAPNSNAARNIADDFTAGAAIAADMFAEGHRIKDAPSVWLDAKSREGHAPGVFVRPYFAAVMGNPAKLEGFMAALSQFIAISEMMTLDPDAYRVSWDDYAGQVSPAPSAEAQAAAEAAFMEGKALYADLTCEALTIGADDPIHAEAYYRGRGVAQNSLALPYLRKLALRPELAPGFAAYLSETLAYHAGSGLTPEAIKATTYQQCVGPVPVYFEDEPDAADSNNAQGV